MAEADPHQRRAHRQIVEAAGLGWIADRGAQTAERQIGSLRHEHHAAPRRQLDGAGTPRPQARHRPEQGALVRTRLADDQDTLARGDLDHGVVERGLAAAERDGQVLEPERPAA